MNTLKHDPESGIGAVSYFFLIPFVLFFMSGFCGLVYEVVWTRMLVLALGNTTLATSTILAAVMAGLSLGCYYWGKFIETREHRFLSVFGILEAGVGVTAILFLKLAPYIPDVEIWLFQTSGLDDYLRIAVRFILCFALLILPTFMMGGTFAVIGKHVIRYQKQFGRDTATLYGINTAGAAIGTFAAGFYMIKEWGHADTLWLTAGINFSIGVIALIVDAILGPKFANFRFNENKKKKTPKIKVSKKVVRLVLISIFISGFTAMAYQVMWTRLLILVIDNSVYSFSIILIAFLLGVTIGSFVFAPFFKYIRKPVVVFAFIEILLAVSAFYFPFTIGFSEIAPDTPYWEMLLKRMSFWIFPPTILMGAALPLATRIYHYQKEKVGRSIGNVLSVNTIGAVTGALAASFYLIPEVGFRNSSLLLPASILILGGAILMTQTRRTATFIVFIGIVGLGLVGLKTMPPDFYHQKYAALEPESRMIYYKEALAATATIFDRIDGTRALYLNGIPEVDSTILSVMTFKLMGALPGLLMEEPSNALMVTYGAGVTSGAASLFAKELDCVDLAAQAKEVSKFFAAVNDNVAERDNVYFHVDDARHFLQNTPKKYSFIVSDATHPRVYDSWVLFTAEFYELIEAKLDRNGIFLQWLPFHGMTTDQYMGIIRTFSSVFEHTSIWRVGNAYTLLMATPEKFSIDFQAFYQRLARKDVQSSLKLAELSNPFEFLRYFSMAEDRIREMLNGYPEFIITDNSPANLFFPFSATLKEQYEIWPEKNYQAIRKNEESVTAYLINIGDETQKEKIIRMVRYYEQQNQ